MPNLPTSLILVLLAVAWLWVLVPMFARSREAVPETDDDAAGFRVLRRAGARLRHSGTRRDRTFGEEQFMADSVDGSDFDGRTDVDLVEVLVDSDDDYADDDYADDAESDDDDYADDDGEAAVVGDHQYDAADDWTTAHRPLAATSHARPNRVADRQRPDREPIAERRPEREHRPGRGGFDPEHDAATAAFRYRRRRLVTLLLVLLTGGLVAGVVLGINDKLWIGATVTGLVLVGYLTYLHRQVRIEREISARRRARAQRAREIRPAAYREAQPLSPYQSEPAEHSRAVPHRSRPAPHTGPVQRPAARSTQLPPHRRRVGTIVDLDDDDPAFDDLDRYEPIVYRRAAGQ